jgi:hypothetical protein
MNLGIQARKKNIISRLAISKAKREERNAKIEEDKQRAEDRTAALTSAQEHFENENAADIGKHHQYLQAVADGVPPELEEDEEPPSKPVFDEKYFLYSYDEDHPAIYIPDEIKDDVDNDWLISNEKREELIIQHH